MAISSSSSSGRCLGVDRFYNPPAVRRQLEQQRQQQQLLNHVRSKPRPATLPIQDAPAVDKQAFENRAGSDDSSIPYASSSSSSMSNSPSPSSSPPPTSPPLVANLSRFLESTTPVVPAQYFPQTSKRGWRKYEVVELCPYFSLADLWESFKEWSAYGAGVPLVLNGGDCVVQYYVPYLSGIQLYLDDSTTKWRSRIPGAEYDVEMYPDAGSDGSSESEVDRAIGKRRDSSIVYCHKDQGGLVGNENGVCDPTVLPVLEYLEHDPPYGREPLAEKISLLANKFPFLKTYRSFDLLPSSWISVAWYPIYRIPTGPTLRDLDACFLTFHSLSTPLISTQSHRHYFLQMTDYYDPNSEVLSQWIILHCVIVLISIYASYFVGDSCNGHSEVNGISNFKDVNNLTQMPSMLSLPVFGLASYKFRGSIWTTDNLDERQFASSLLQAAEDRLRLLKVDHPDFRFFLSHYRANLH